MPQSRELLERYRSRAGLSDVRGFEWHFLAGLCDNASSHHSLLAHHDADAYFVRFFEEGRLFATAGGDRLADIRDASTGKVMVSFRGHTDCVNSLAVSPDRKTVATASCDRTVMLWDAENGEHRLTLTGHAHEVRRVAFSPDGRTLFSGGKEEVKLWNTHDFTERVTLGRPPDEFCHLLAVSPGGETFATHHTTGAPLRFWDTNTLTERASFGRAIPHVGAFSADGIHFATADYDGSIRVWELTNGREIIALRHDASVRSIAFSSDGDILAVGLDNGSVQLWDVHTGQRRNLFKGHTGAVWCVAWSPDNRAVATAGADGSVKLWKSETPDIFSFRREFPSQVLSIAYSADARLIAVGLRDGSIELCDVYTGDTTARLVFKPSVTALAFSPDGRFLAGGGRGSYAMLWNLPGLETSIQLDCPGAESSVDVGTLEFSPDSRWLGLTCSDQLMFWDLDRGNPHPVRFAPNSWKVGHFAILPDSRRVAVFGGEATNEDLRIWHITTGEWNGAEGISEFRRPLAIDRNGRMILSRGLLLGFESRTSRIELRGHKRDIVSEAISPDGRTAATADGGGTLKLWNVDTGRELFELTVPDPRGGFHCGSLAFAPDGSSLAAAGWTPDDIGYVVVMNCKRLSPPVRSSETSTIEEAEGELRHE